MRGKWKKVHKSDDNVDRFTLFLARAITSFCFLCGQIYPSPKQQQKNTKIPNENHAKS